MTTYVTDKARVLSALRGARSRFGMTASQVEAKTNIGKNSVYSHLSALRRDGHRIVSVVDQKLGVNRYSLQA